MSFLFDNKKIELNNMTDINSNITCIIEEMDLTKLSKTELLEKCEELGIKKRKSKNKGELIEIINTHIPKKQIELIIEDELDDDESCNSNTSNAKDKKNIEQEDELPGLYNDLMNNTPNQEINQIYNVDCITKLKTYNDKIINLTILDPPYYKVVNEKWDHLWKNEIDYLTWFEELVVEVSRVSKNNSALYLFGYWRMLYKQIPILEKYGFQFKQSVTIDKGIRSIGGRKTTTYTIFPNTTEHLLYFVKDNYQNIKKYLKMKQKQLGKTSLEINTQLGCKTNGGGMWSIYTGNNICKQIPTESYWNKLQDILEFNIPYDDVKFTFNIEMGITDVWSDINFYEENRIHPTQKPQKLLDRIIKASSNEGDLILDPFLGSGNTIKSCIKLKRNYIGMEMSSEYFKNINLS